MHCASYLLRLCWTSIICSLSNKFWNFFSWVFPRRMVFLGLVKRVVCGLSRCFLQSFPFVPPKMCQLQQSVFSPILNKNDMYGVITPHHLRKTMLNLYYLPSDVASLQGLILWIPCIQTTIWHTIIRKSMILNLNKLQPSNNISYKMWEIP